VAPPPPGLSTLCQAICQELRKTAISDLLLHLLDVISNPETLDASLFFLLQKNLGQAVDGLVLQVVIMTRRDGQPPGHLLDRGVVEKTLPKEAGSGFVARQQGRQSLLQQLPDPQFGPVIMFGLGGVFVEVMKDVSFRLVPVGLEDVREMIQEIKKRQKETTEYSKMAAVGTLTAGIAHELNNPLNNIHISAQILSQEIHNDNVKLITETVDDILSQSIRVKKIISELLEFARDRAPEKSLINLPDLIRRVYEQISKVSLTDGIRFVINAPEDLQITADSAQIERVFVNLINNAIEAMGGRGDIIVNISTDEDVVKIEMTDTGPGIPKDNLDKLFDPFFTTKDKGTGLGLSIAYNIIKNHYGRIEAESIPGKGATFVIYLMREI